MHSPYASGSGNLARVAALVLDPSTLIGDRIIGVTVAWEVRGDRRPVAYFFRFASGTDARATVTDDGTVQLVAESPRSTIDGPEVGTVEFEAVEASVAIASVVGQTIVGVDRVWWLGGGGIGLRLRVDNADLIVAVDEVRDHYEVWIGVDDLGEDWGHEPIA